MTTNGEKVIFLIEVTNWVEIKTFKQAVSIHGSLLFPIYIKGGTYDFDHSQANKLI